MHSIIAGINAIIIASSVLTISCVCSLPTQPIGADLDIFSSTPQPLPTCFEPYPHPHIGEIRSIHKYAVDSEGRPCFESYNESEMRRLLDKTNFESNYVNVTAKNCPTWPQMKQCFRDHVNSHKCSEEERQRVVDSEFVNSHIIFAELLCNPERAQYFRNLWKNALKAGLCDCIFGKEFHELSEECDATKFDEHGHRAPFKDLGLFFECMKPGVRKCAKGDNAKEIKLVQLWEDYDRALQDTHLAFWN